MSAGLSLLSKLVKKKLRRFPAGAKLLDLFSDADSLTDPSSLQMLVSRNPVVPLEQ